MNRRDKLKAKKRYDSFSLVERNAYEEIVNRKRVKSNVLMIPYEFLALITKIGIFFLVFCYMTGVDLKTFREIYISLAFMLLQLIIPAMLILTIISIVNIIRLNKFKLKLLLN